MPSSYTFAQLITALARETQRGKFPVDIDTTSLGGTTTAVVSDLAFGSSGATTNAFHDAWIRIMELVASGPAVGEISKVLSTGGFTVASGTLTVAPAFSLAVQTGTDLLFLYGLHPSEFTNAINRILRNLTHYAYLLISLVTDGDLEDTGVTNWAAVGVPTTREKTTTAVFPYGRQNLHLAGAGSGVGATSNSVRVTPDEPLYISVPVRVDAGSMQVILRDVTNSSTIGDPVTISATGDLERAVVEARFQRNANSTTNNVAVRVLGNEAASEFYVGPVSLLSGHRDRYSVDTGSVERGADILEVLRSPQGAGAQISDVFVGFPNALEPMSFGVEMDDRSQQPINVLISRSWASWHPLFMRVKKRFAELSLDSDTTFADRDTVVQGAAHYIEKARAALATGREIGVHEARAREYSASFARRRASQGYGLIISESPGERVLVQ